jgi:hypothetical protein
MPFMIVQLPESMTVNRSPHGQFRSLIRHTSPHPSWIPSSLESAQSSTAGSESPKESLQTQERRHPGRTDSRSLGPHRSAISPSPRSFRSRLRRRLALCGTARCGRHRPCRGGRATIRTAIFAFALAVRDSAAYRASSAVSRSSDPFGANSVTIFPRTPAAGSRNPIIPTIAGCTTVGNDSLCFRALYQCGSFP